MYLRLQDMCLLFGIILPLHHQLDASVMIL